MDTETRMTEEQLAHLIAQRDPKQQPECEHCLYAFNRRNCVNCTVQGGTGEEAWLPFGGWE
ncbi:MAG: hypothetical protein WC683_01855 [bacterium]